MDSQDHSVCGFKDSRLGLCQLLLSTKTWTRIEAKKQTPRPEGLNVIPSFTICLVTRVSYFSVFLLSYLEVVILKVPTSRLL